MKLHAGITRTRWAAIGAAVAITLGAGGIGLVDAAKSSGERGVYTAIQPCRLLDTRPNQNIQRNTPLGQGEIWAVPAIGNNGQCSDIPADTVALELNVTGLLNTANTDFVVWSGAGAPPNASQLNLAAGAAPTPNSVTTELSGSSFSIRNKFGSAHVIVDIVGVYQDHNHDDRYYTKSQVDQMTPTVRVVEELVSLPVNASEAYTVTCPSGESPLSGGWGLASGSFFSGDVMVTQSFRGGWGGSFDPASWGFEIVNFTGSPGTYLLQVQCISTVPSGSADRSEGDHNWTPPVRTQVRP